MAKKNQVKIMWDDENLQKPNKSKKLWDVIYLFIYLPTVF